MIYTSHYNSPVGGITLAGQDEALIGLWIDGQKYFLGSVNNTVIEKETPALTAAKRWLDRYFAGEKPEIGELRLNPSGSEFRRKVWDILCTIPYGETVSYGGIAGKIAAETGSRMSAQAVGGAVGKNPISIIIPCHRVVGTDGSLTGYAGGIPLKIKLLRHEGADMSSLYIPSKGTAL